MKILSVCTSVPEEDAAWWRISNIARIADIFRVKVGDIRGARHYCARHNFRYRNCRNFWMDKGYLEMSKEDLKVDQYPHKLKHRPRVLIHIAWARWEQIQTEPCLCKELSRYYKVFYVQISDASMMKPINFLKSLRIKVKEKSEKLSIVEIPNLILPTKWYRWRVTQWWNEHYIYWLLKVFFKQYWKEGNVILGTAYPWVSRTAFCRLQASLKYYHCVDNMPSFAGPNAIKIRRAEEEIEGHADCIFVVAEALKELSPFRKKAIVVNNATDISCFNNTSSFFPADLPKGQPIVGYCGRLDLWFDYETIRIAAESRPNYNFVLIGSVDKNCKKILETLTKNSNVFWLDKKPYEMISVYISSFNVATIPFKLDEIGYYADPLKLYDYFAAGKPVLASAMPEVKKWQPYIDIYESPEEFIFALDKIIGGDHPNTSELKAIAKNNTWKDRAELIHSILEEHMLRKFTGDKLNTRDEGKMRFGK